jgi:hypothetical protein
MALNNELVEGWQPDPRVAKWAENAGFGKSRSMDEKSLRALSKTRGGRPAGLYLWEAVDHGIYIGISSESVTKRLRAHVREYPQANIQQFRYMEANRNSTKLREVERDLIYQAIREGFDCFNTEHSASIYGSSTYDDTISVARQKAWFDDPAGENKKARAGASPLTSAGETRANKKYPQFKARPDSDKITDAISLYLRTCVPFPVETEGAYWGLTCLPSTKMVPGYKRISTLSMGMLEMLWFTEGPGGKVHVNLGTDYRFLPPRSWTMRRLGAKVTDYNHDSGGPYEAILRFKNVDSFISALEKSQQIRVAAARFALDRMRKGRLAGRYRDAHNGLLAAEALSRVDGWNLSSRPLSDIYDPDIMK